MLTDRKFSRIVGNIFSKQLEEYVNAKKILENWIYFLSSIVPIFCSDITHMVIYVLHQQEK